MEIFFRISVTFDALTLKEFLIKRYKYIDYDMDASEFISFVVLACEKHREEEAERQWLVLYPFMIMKMIKYVTLEQYIDDATGRNIDKRSVEEILQEIDTAMMSLERN